MISLWKSTAFLNDWCVENMKVLRVSTAFLFTAASAVLAHPGGLNRQGCHNDRKNGGYHCHQAPKNSVPAPLTRKSGSVVYYPNCASVRAAGAAPILAGEPGYSRRLDRDGDGIACE
jgi:hypothetical protein